MILTPQCNLTYFVRGFAELAKEDPDKTYDQLIQSDKYWDIDKILDPYIADSVKEDKVF